MEITLHPPKENRRRNYGVKFSVNGTSVASKPVVAKTGDTVTWQYLGGNISQGTDGGKAWRELKAAGMDTSRRSGTFVIP